MTASAPLVPRLPRSRLAGVLSVVVVLVLLVLTPATPTVARSSDAWGWPLGSEGLGRRFEPPASDYGPGHRGIDVAGSVGDPVRAVAAGQVSFAGRVGGVDVVTVDHGRERSTYQPVRARVEVGDAVARGDVLGTLLGSPSHCTGPCLHLGRVAGETYLDPLDLLGGGRFRLVSPDGPPPDPPAGVGDGSLQRPVGGPVTSAFGMRVHPITGVRKLHDGTDFGVPCGTPVRAAAAGTVVSTSTGSVYGTRIVVQHRPGFETSYNHLSSRGVGVGASVRAGGVIGRVGSTGLSTGCHLHFMVVVDGKPVNPQSLL